MKRLILLVLVVIIFVAGCSNTKDEGFKMIGAKEVKSIIDKYDIEDNVFIVDVREKDEYEEGHLSFSINVPLSNIESIENIESIKKNSKIIVYCRSGNRSKTAQMRLIDMGYTEVYDMGGILDWTYELVVDY